MIAEHIDKLQNPLYLIIDMQNAYKKGNVWECPRFDIALLNIKTLLANVPPQNCIMTRYIASKRPAGVWKDYNKINAEVNKNKQLNRICDELLPYTNKIRVYDKSKYSSYCIDEVREAAKNASCVVVTGVVADCCVLSTVFSLIDAGKYVVYLADAVAGVSPETEQATITALKGLAYVHLSLTTTRKYLEALHMSRANK